MNENRAGAAPAAPEEPGARTAFVNAALAEGAWELRLSAGVGHEAPDLWFHGIGALNYAITDRLSWSLPLPAFSYRWGENGSAELIARAGLVGFGYSGEEEGFLGFTDAGITAQAWLARELSLVAHAVVEWDFQTTRQPNAPSRSDDLTLRASLGLSWRPAEVITLSAASGLAHDIMVHDSAVQYALRSELTFGALQALGYRPLPLVQVHLSTTFSLDAYAAWAVSLRSGIESRQRYTLGFTWEF